MISVLLKINRTNLRRDRVVQAMVFIMPVVFFSIFAMVFGRRGSDATPRLSVVVVDEDRSSMSMTLVEAMKADAGLAVRDSVRAAGAARGDDTRVPVDRARATTMVREGDAPVAVILPKGWGATFPNFTGQGMKADVVADVSDPVASHVIVGVLQRCAGVALRGGPAAIAGTTEGAPTGPNMMSLVATNVVDLMGDKKRDGRMVSFYAAGVAVMFLLFSASGAGGSLLDEQESGTLERVLGTRAGMGGLLAAKWLHITMVGILQITVMFVWGMLMFQLDLMHHLPGFAVMTVMTAAAAAAFGLVLATVSRSRGQLQAISNIVILSMSALGGSMFPRFLMSEGMQKVGLVTFNAWALDGYIKVFWRELPVSALLPQVGVLFALTVVFLFAARTLARRWEAA